MHSVVVELDSGVSQTVVIMSSAITVKSVRQDAGIYQSLYIIVGRITSSSHLCAPHFINNINNPRIHSLVLCNLESSHLTTTRLCTEVTQFPGMPALLFA